VLSRRTAQGDLVRDEYFTIKLADGSQQHLNLSVAPLVDEDGRQTGFMAIISDITERERLLQQTEHEHQLLEAVMNNVDAGVAACDE
jgi:PAS domain S-box-containing protein